MNRPAGDMAVGTDAPEAPMLTTFAPHEAILGNAQPRKTVRSGRGQARKFNAGPATIDELGRAELVAIILEVEGEPVENPPLLFKLTVAFGFGVIGLAAGSTALVAATFLGLAG
jgi:hypothetical protein